MSRVILKRWKRVFITISLGLAIPLLGILCYYAYIFYLAFNAPYGFFVSNDCPDSYSYGSAAINGTIRNTDLQPISNAYIRVWKHKGGCPQSEGFEIVLRPDDMGQFTVQDLPVHLGDPPVQIAILVPSYRLCVFEFDAARHRHAALTLEITIRQDKLIIFGEQAFGTELDRLLFFKETITPCTSA